VQYRRIGKTNIEVPVICGGCMALVESPTYGTQAGELSARTIRAALDEGINFFDTAEMYGDGQSEELLGRALKGVRERVVVTTKVGPENLRGEDLPAACERSLKRLQTDYIDLYMIHWPNHEVPLTETVSALEKLKEQGKIRAIGVSNFGKLDLREILSYCRVEANQVPYSLLWRVIEHEIVELCVESDVSILCYSPLAQGLLAGKFERPQDVPPQRRRARYCRPGVINRVFQFLAEFRSLSADINTPTIHLALAWLLCQRGVASVVAGMRSPEQARLNARAGGVKLDRTTLMRLDRLSAPIKEVLDKNPDMWQEESRYR